MEMKVFFDFICPFCYRANENINKIREEFPELEIDLSPCEVIPKPYNAVRHSDLALRGLYYVKEKGGDIFKYTELVFNAHFEEKRNIEDMEVIMELAEKSGVSGDEIREILTNEKYSEKQRENNKLAWEIHGFEAVPSYTIGEKVLASSSGNVPDYETLKSFVKNNIN